MSAARGGEAPEAASLVIATRAVGEPEVASLVSATRTGEAREASSERVPKRVAERVITHPDSG